MIREHGEERLVGTAALDRSDTPLGEVREVWVDESTDRPMWASVRVPVLDQEVLVPLDGAEWDGAAVHLPIPGPSVVAAPHRSASEPTDQDQERLYTHYGIPTVRTPRSREALLALGDGEVCYAVHKG